MMLGHYIGELEKMICKYCAFYCKEDDKQLCAHPFLDTEEVKAEQDACEDFLDRELIGKQADNK